VEGRGRCVGLDWMRQLQETLSQGMSGCWVSQCNTRRQQTPSRPTTGRTTQHTKQKLQARSAYRLLQFSAQRNSIWKAGAEEFGVCRKTESGCSEGWSVCFVCSSCPSYTTQQHLNIKVAWKWSNQHALHWLGYWLCSWGSALRFPLQAIVFRESKPSF
jgi:hypothetical protein